MLIWWVSVSDLMVLVLACFDGVGACSLAASFRRVTQVKGRDWGRSHHQALWWQIFIVVWREKRGGEMLVLMTKMKRMTTIVYVKTAGHTPPLTIWCFCPTIARQWESPKASDEHPHTSTDYCCDDDFMLLMVMLKFFKLGAPGSHGLRVPGQFEEIVSLCELNDHTLQ